MQEALHLYVNGEPRSFEGALTVADLLERFRLAPQRVAVELNEQLVRRAQFEQTTLRAGDRVEIVTLVGGG
jgi:sulfur carrier protein